MPVRSCIDLLGNLSADTLLELSKASANSSVNLGTHGEPQRQRTVLALVNNVLSLCGNAIT